LLPFFSGVIHPGNTAVGSSSGGAAVIIVHAMGHAGPAVAGDPDDLALDAGGEIAAAPVLGEEGVQVGQQAHRRERTARRRRRREAARRLARARPLLNDLVRPRQHGRRDREAERLGGLHIDDQLERGRLLDGQVARLGAFEDLVHEVGGAPMQVV
jgi:hypothetical protein